MATTLTEMTPATVISGLAALAHETRLCAVPSARAEGLRRVRAPASWLGSLGVPPQTLSFHVKEMARAGLLTSRREGRHIFYAVDFEHVRQLGAYLTDSCCADEPERCGVAIERTGGPCPASM